MSSGAALEPAVAVRYRRAIIAGQALAGLGIGATITMGSLLASRIGGSEGWAGLAAAMSTLGSAIAAIPLARVAARRGRRVSLVTGALIAAAGAMTIMLAGGLGSIPVLTVGLAAVGVGSAVNLQARFAVTDVSTPERRARDLSIVVWATTAGAILGPNLNAVGEIVGGTIGLPTDTGPFLFTTIAQLAAASMYWFGIPGGIVAGNSVRPARGGVVTAPSPRVAALAIAVIAFAHVTMVAVMSITPVHLVHEGHDLAYAGFVVSLHVAGMYAFAPVFGFLADRIGRIATMALGEAVLLGSLLLTGLMPMDATAVTLGLFLLGLGWSAVTVAGATLMSENAPADRRTLFQGRSDTVQSASGALAAVAAGPVMAAFTYAGLSLATIIVVASGSLLLVIARLVRSRAR
jgi:MFS family permease